VQWFARSYNLRLSKNNLKLGKKHASYITNCRIANWHQASYDNHTWDSIHLAIISMINSVCTRKGRLPDMPNRASHDLSVSLMAWSACLLVMLQRDVFYVMWLLLTTTALIEKLKTCVSRHALLCKHFLADYYLVEAESVVQGEGWMRCVAGLGTC
jgi:hypothetical protein